MVCRRRMCDLADQSRTHDDFKRSSARHPLIDQSRRGSAPDCGRHEHVRIDNTRTGSAGTSTSNFACLLHSQTQRPRLHPTTMSQLAQPSTHVQNSRSTPRLTDASYRATHQSDPTTHPPSVRQPRTDDEAHPTQPRSASTFATLPMDRMATYQEQHAQRQATLTSRLCNRPYRQRWPFRTCPGKI